MKVPLFDLAGELATVRREVDAAIARVLDSGQVVMGPEVAAFERELAAAAGARHAIGTSSGTDSLYLIYQALGVGPGTELVTTPFTFVATAGGASRLGARVVFADIDDATLTLDPVRAASAVTSRTRAIAVVNLFGHPATLPQADAAIVEDAAHRPLATPRGIASALSFYPTKNLGALGDAGAILTADPVLADRLALLRSQGARPKYHHVAVGGNFRMDELQAAILRAKLSHVARWTVARREQVARYRALFAAAKLPPELRLPAEHPDHAHHHFVIRTPRRDALRAHLAASGVGTEVYYPEPLHLAPCFADLGYRAGSLPVAERACAEVLALPLYPTLHQRSHAYVVDRIASFFAM